MRELRALVIFEIAAVIALAVAPLPDSVPVVVPLFAIASLARWARGRSWGELFHGGQLAASLGAIAGVASLGLAVIVGAPAIEAISGRAVEWSTFPILRGNPSQLFVILIYSAIVALAAELALRGWLVERVLELAAGRPNVTVLAIAAGAFAEAIVTHGHGAMRLGAAVFGIGMGILYVGGKRSIVTPMLARIVFVCGTAVLESLRLIG